MDANLEEDVCYPQPKTLAQRVAIAKDFVARFHYPVPLVVDDMANSADAVYAGWPERFYVIDEENRIVFKGALGPGGFDPEAVEAWLAERFPGTPTPVKKEPETDRGTVKAPARDAAATPAESEADGVPGR